MDLNPFNNRKERARKDPFSEESLAAAGGPQFSTEPSGFRWGDDVARDADGMAGGSMSRGREIPLEGFLPQVVVERVEEAAASPLASAPVLVGASAVLGTLMGAVAAKDPAKGAVAGLLLGGGGPLVLAVATGAIRFGG